MVDVLDLEELDRQEAVDHQYLVKHGLDKPLKLYFGIYDWGEIVRQTEYLIEHHTEIPRSVVARRATFLLAHYSSGERPPHPSIVLLFGKLLDVSAYPVKYAKKPAHLIHAQAYLRENPGASNSEISRAVGVNRSTVGRWKKEGHI